MAEPVNAKAVEQILIRVDAKDLVNFKSVCKSWHSLITSPDFIKRHLNHSYNKDCNNKEIGHRRITLFSTSRFINDYGVVGSSNGLVCLHSLVRFNLSVGNPLTRELREIKLPPLTGSPLCWGFGYDSSVDDYKVVVGIVDERSFHVLSLKSNVWKVVGVIGKHLRVRNGGILCNGALHWIASDYKNKKRARIISYDLSKEEFKEIPQPNDARYKCGHLGVMNDCLCIFVQTQKLCVDSVWLMKEYNVKESWKLLSADYETEYDVVHFLKSPKDEITRPLEHFYWEYMGAPIYVQSLVPPQVNAWPKFDKRLVSSNDNESPKSNSGKVLKQLKSFSLKRVLSLKKSK